MADIEQIDEKRYDFVANSEVITILVQPDGEPHIFTQLPLERQLQILTELRDIVDANITWQADGCPELVMED